MSQNNIQNELPFNSQWAIIRGLINVIINFGSFEAISKKIYFTQINIQRKNGFWREMNRILKHIFENIHFIMHISMKNLLVYETHSALKRLLFSSFDFKSKNSSIF